MKSIHEIEKSELLKMLETNLEGLEEKAVLEKQKNGLNVLPKQKPKSFLNMLVMQFLTPLMIILSFAGAASIFIDETVDAIFIGVVILINAVLGAYQEWNAERKAFSLQDFIKEKVKVKRNGEIIIIDSEFVVLGDVVFLEAGNKVPADIRIFESFNLSSDESFLTGESKPVNKDSTDNPSSSNISYSNMLYAGSTVLNGRATGIVVAVGLDTEVGKIADNLHNTKHTKPPLVIRVNAFIKQISIFILIVVSVMAIILRLRGMSFSEIFPFAITVSVSAIPESLAIALTVVLSIATVRMAKKNVIVRKLNAVESLGSCTVIASDKTGTLTLNQQTAEKVILPDGSIYEISEQGYHGDGKIKYANDNAKNTSNINNFQLLCKISILANEGHLEKKNNEWKHHGDSIDVAFLAMAHKNNVTKENVLKKYEMFGMLPYESEKRYAAAFYRNENKTFIGIKGAPETLLEKSKFMQIKDDVVSIDIDLIMKQVSSLTNKGYRVLAIAGNHIDTDEQNIDNINDLIFFGIVAFLDPLRPNINEAILKCKMAGIKVIMITGDQKDTAYHIGKEMGIINNLTFVKEGKDIELIKENKSELMKIVKETIVFARVSPYQKQLIVQTLKDLGEFVAVTGDGVNDAPALKNANIGVAMGSGTDIAIQTSSMIITDDNFLSIVDGIEEGRYAYDNFRKVTYLLISTAIAELLIFAIAILMGSPIPLLPTQILWLNLVTNGIQDVALAFEKGEKETMKKKPRPPKENIFNGQMLEQTILSGIVIAITSLVVWIIVYYGLNLGIYESRATLLLTLFILQNFHVLNCRSEHKSLFKIPLLDNKVIIYGFFAQLVLQLFAMYTPFMNKVLYIKPISLYSWLILLLVGIPLIIVMETYKKIKSR
jgi:magnesium-transporting ATPase (P-type)